MVDYIKEARDYSQWWIDIIHKPSVSADESKVIIEESKQNFANYFNRGWLDYRK